MREESTFIMKGNIMIPLSIGILSWRSNKSIRATLDSYKINGLLNLSNDITILFQEARPKDIQLAKKYGIKFIALDENIGIGQAFKRLAIEAKERNILLLEHDWNLVEDAPFTKDHLSAAIDLIDKGVHCVRLRHRHKFGFPHYSIDRYKGEELTYFDDWIQLHHPHLIDALHWEADPELKWPNFFEKQNNFYIVDSSIGNWTNNPCIFNKDFYLNTIERFAGEGIDLEKNISYWWARQNFKIAQGQGLFEHNDIDKYQISPLESIWKKIKRKVDSLC